MPITANKLAATCPHCGVVNTIHNAKDVTSIECSSCHRAMQSTELVGDVRADTVEVVDLIDTFNLDDM